MRFNEMSKSISIQVYEHQKMSKSDLTKSDGGRNQISEIGFNEMSKSDLTKSDGGRKQI